MIRPLVVSTLLEILVLLGDDTISDSDDIGVSTLLEILAMRQALQSLIDANFVFQPFLRFWFICRLPGGTQICLPVSTLLEILESIVPWARLQDLVLFQPFLRFWMRSLPNASRSGM